MADDPVQPQEPAPQPPPAALKGGGKFTKDSIWEVYFPSKDITGKQGVPVASFPMIIYFWPTMVGLLVCGLLQHFTSVDTVATGWWVTGLLSFNLMVIVTDLDQKKFLIVVLFLALISLGLYMGASNDWAVLAWLANWLRGLTPTYNTQTLFILFFVLWFFFVLGMLQPRLDYWRFEPNEFVHYIQPWGRDQSVPRLGSTVTREVPDVLELLLTFGGGTLVIRREGQVVARIEHVPFLGRRMVALEQLLGVTRVQVDRG